MVSESGLGFLSVKPRDFDWVLSLRVRRSRYDGCVLNSQDVRSRALVYPHTPPGRCSRTSGRVTHAVARSGASGGWSSGSRRAVLVMGGGGRKLLAKPDGSPGRTPQGRTWPGSGQGSRAKAGRGVLLGHLPWWLPTKSEGATLGKDFIPSRRQTASREGSASVGAAWELA